MEKERILKDIKLFEENTRIFDDEKWKNNKVIEMARRYYDDAKYYLSEKDFFTAFGCINYAHGLVDAIRMEEFKGEK